MPDPDDGDESVDAPPDRSAGPAAATEADVDASEGEPLQSTAESDTDGTGRSDNPDASAAGDAAAGSDQSVVAAVGDPDIEEVLDEERRLDTRVRILWIARRLVPALFLGGLAGFLAFRFDVVTDTATAAGVGTAVFALVLGYGVVRSLLLYRSWRYVVREDSLYLTRGVFTIVQTIVPYVRVQHIDTRRSAFERALGLASLVVYTAGSRGADVTIPGLTPESAEKLQSRLKRLAIESEDEDAV
jgi:membrane protein YdbS with pleckstrin-like domain